MLSGPGREHLLGFDARLAPAGLGASWPPARRAGYLLRDDVAAPLSTDVHVWPSATTAAAAAAAAGAAVSPPLPGLWPNLAVLARIEPDAGGAWTIAITRAGAAGAEVWWEPSPAAADPAWTLLGYDVSDAALLSGLANCGYGGERAQLRRAWGPHLNELHLFRDAERADGFRVSADLRAPEHAPFFVHGLYRLPPTP